MLSLFGVSSLSSVLLISQPLIVFSTSSHSHSYSFSLSLCSHKIISTFLCVSRSQKSLHLVTRASNIENKIPKFRCEILANFTPNHEEKKSEKNEKIVKWKWKHILPFAIYYFTLPNRWGDHSISFFETEFLYIFTYSMCVTKYIFYLLNFLSPCSRTWNTFSQLLHLWPFR